MDERAGSGIYRWRRRNGFSGWGERLAAISSSNGSVRGEKIRKNGQNYQANNHDGTSDGRFAFSEPPPDQLKITFVLFSFRMKQFVRFAISCWFVPVLTVSIDYPRFIILAHRLFVTDARVEPGQGDIRNQVANDQQQTDHQQDAGRHILIALGD